MIKWSGFLFLVILGMQSLFGDLPDVFYGKCYDKKGKLIVEEKHEIFKDDGKVVKIRTLYFPPESSDSFAYAESYFKDDDYLPNFYFHRKEDDYVSRSVKLGKTDVVLLRKGTAQDYYFEKSYTVEDDMVVGHGFYFYMFHFLDELLSKSGEKVPVHFLIPNKLSKYHFLMSAAKDPDNPDIAVLTLKTKNILGRIFLRRIILKVDLKKRHLVSYEGPNTFFYGAEQTPFVKIQYSDQKF